MTTAEYLEKRLYVYRKSYKYYSKIRFAISFSKALFALSSLGGIVYTPIFGIAGVYLLIELLDSQLKISYKLNERIAEYKSVYHFYYDLLQLLKSNNLKEEEIHLNEYRYIDSIKYLPREKHLKEMHLNGY